MSLIFLVCFFFQAEDGIRDLTVTGVQTCALPIFGQVAHRQQPVSKDAILLFGIFAYRLLPVSDLPNVDFPTIQVNASLPGEIGRASCRERVKIWVDAGPVERKKGDDYPTLLYSIT